MQSTTSRYLILAAMLSLGALAFSVVAHPVTPAPVRWPTEEQFVSAEGWSSQPGSTERINDTQFVTREYVKGGTAASLVIKTGAAAKGIYRSGPDVPFLGSGFSVTPAPAEFVPQLNGGGGFVAERGEQSYLVFYAYGERRGLLGNGAFAWSLAAVDGVLGQANHYYLMTLLAPLNRSRAAEAVEVGELAQTLFARTAAGYSP